MGIDHIEDLVTMAKTNIRRDPKLAQLMDEERLKIVLGDGRKGYEQDAPYDCIHIGAASPKEPTVVSLGLNLFTFFDKFFGHFEF